MCTFSYKIALRVTRETVKALYLPIWLEHSGGIFFYSKNSTGKSIIAGEFPLLMRPWWIFEEMSSYLEIRASWFYMFNFWRSCDAPRQRGFSKMEQKKASALISNEFWQISIFFIPAWLSLITVHLLAPRGRTSCFEKVLVLLHQYIFIKTQIHPIQKSQHCIHHRCNIKPNYQVTWHCIFGCCLYHVICVTLE